MYPKSNPMANSLRKTVMTLVAVMLALTAMSVSASDPVGVYCMVDKVIFEPNEANAELIQVWGVFALAMTGGDIYSEPMKGYMYFSVPSGREAVARKEWADLKSVAGTGQGVAFGARYASRDSSNGQIYGLGTVRKADAKPGNPDVYAANGNGVSKVNPAPGYQDNMTNVINKLKAVTKPKS